ncbi:MAG: MarR family transcriptional regulator [Novosphingobium sp.]
MHGPFDSRHPLTSLVDEAARLHGRLKSAYASAWRSAGLNESEAMVLTAVIEADRLPTVPQIGRSLGHSRQLIQRAVNALIERGLVGTLSNPDHKRAVLLRGTESGLALKRRIDTAADQIANSLAAGVDLDTVRGAAGLLRIVRKQFEARLRQGDGEDSDVGDHTQS